MKKFLLSMAVLATTSFAAQADVITDLDQTYEDMTEYPYYLMNEPKPEIKDGSIVFTNETKGNPWSLQYFVCYDFKVNSETTYTMTASIKSSGSGKLQISFGNWDAQIYREAEITGDNEWHDVTVQFNEVKTEKTFVLFQIGDIVGTMEVRSVKVTHEGENTTPTDRDVIATFYDGNGGYFIGWGNGTREQSVEEDGKTCLKFTNEEAEANAWDSQIAYDYDKGFEPGKTYYLTFDVKGTPFKGLTSGFQDSKTYSGLGDMNSFNVTEDWQTVTISGTPTEKEGNTANRWICNLGKYVGTMYISNAMLYTDKSTGVNNVAELYNGRTVVYNLMGIKVLDSENAEDVNNLPSGLYIVNGKKTLVRNR